MGAVDIAAQLGAIFAHHPTASYVARVRDVRSVGIGLWLLRAEAGMIPPGKSELMPERNAVQCLLVLSEADRSTIAHFQNTPARFDGRPELVQQMTEALTTIHRAGTLVARA